MWGSPEVHKFCCTNWLRLTPDVLNPGGFALLGFRCNGAFGLTGPLEKERWFST